MEKDDEFHLEKDMCTDPEKNKRRSSIMKLKVTSQSDHNTDTFSGKSLRRVSFASSNFVKPFAADPDENTIWDRTYEEAVNHTDSSKSSEETQGPASKIMNVSSFQIWESKSLQYAIPNDVEQSDKENFVPIAKAACSDDTNLNQTEMEITGTYGNCNQGPAKLTIVEYVRSRQRSCINNDGYSPDMSFTCTYPVIEKGDEDQIDLTQVNKTVHTMSDMDISYIQDQDVEVDIPPIVRTDLRAKESKKDSGITETSIRIKPKPDETVVQPVDMEFTSDMTRVVENINSFVPNDNSPMNMSLTSNLTSAVRNLESSDSPMDMTLTSNLTSAVKNLESFVDNVYSPVDMEFTTLQGTVENHTDNMHHLPSNSPTYGDIAEKISDIHNSIQEEQVVVKGQILNSEIMANEGGEGIEKHKSTEDSINNDTLAMPIDKDIELFSVAQASDEKFRISVQVKEPPPVSGNEVITDAVNISHNSLSYDKNKSYSTSAPIPDEGKCVKETKILYSQPIKSILKRNDVSCNVVTPSESFSMSLNSMSPCVETTQQLIHATFSKPESIDILLQGRNAPTQKNEDPSLNKSVSNKIPADQEAADVSKLDSCWDKIRDCKSICDITPPLMDNEALDEAPDKTEPVEESFSKDTTNYQNYSLRSEEMIANIEKLLRPIEIDYDDTAAEELCNKLCEQHEENTRVLKGLLENFKFPVFEVVDLEEIMREDGFLEESSSSQLSEGVSDEGGCQNKGLSMPDMVLPMTLHQRVCEAAQRCEKYWQFVKSDENYYYFFGCFRAVPFKVNVHPDLGRVYAIETFNNLSDESVGITHYDARVFIEKLKQEHLILHLGPNFDLIALLDYICLCTDEIEKFHLEFRELVSKYGYSHKLKFNHDNSVIFEILEENFIIWWKIIVKFSILNVGHIESVSATHELSEKVDEGHIKSIAEGSLTGPNFLRCFIEKVDEYVQRIGKRILMKREARLKYGNREQ